MDKPLVMDELLINLTNELNVLLGQIEIKEVNPVTIKFNVGTLNAKDIMELEVN